MSRYLVDKLLGKNGYSFVAAFVFSLAAPSVGLAQTDSAPPPSQQEMSALQQAQAQAQTAGEQAAAEVSGFQPLDPLSGSYPTGLLGEEEEEEKPKAKRVMFEDLPKEVAGTNEAPPEIGTLQNLPRENTLVEGKSGMPLDIRRDAVRAAAISYGARGGLAWRTYQIRSELAQRTQALDKVYDFRSLLIPAPSGLLIEPPIISESINAMLIEGDGQTAAVSDRIYNIINNAKIVSTSRTWRTYLEREWGVVDPPPDILRPENEEERKIWKELVSKGWEEGMRQADEIFQDDLNVLMADFQGMIRYRMLLTQGMVSPPYALQVDRGVTGGGSEMRVGDRAVQITGVPELITGSDQWQPASR
ncbi:MAG: type IV secretion system DotC family protein [Alphaproteobacteria bacterium]